jgi:hypothetical protein
MHKRMASIDQQNDSLRRLVAAIQAGYFLITGIWPLLHIRSFEWVSGPKVDRWLVKTVSALIAVIGTAIGLAAWRRRLTPEIEALGVGSALALASVDVVYVARRRIRWVYLLDAAAEVALAAAWVVTQRSIGLSGRAASSTNRSTSGPN